MVVDTISYINFDYAKYTYDDKLEEDPATFLESNSGEDSQVGMIAGATVGTAAFVALVILALISAGRRKREAEADRQERVLNTRPQVFELEAMVPLMKNDANPEADTNVT
ncbi:hypothetical protein FA15DRAFT_222214 [Coprinopsis marcescibilis]|uniref:Uncharacterized protein n=1 Tax=Coprinopsis marcescibilis TaxID=230819 RepID=A0A5C3KG61_COPMA|nr:hypothetical protein FA15DRAFT_222214 [Coprinopsis marcescibilis]